MRRSLPGEAIRRRSSVAFAVPPDPPSEPAQSIPALPVALFAGLGMTALGGPLWATPALLYMVQEYLTPQRGSGHNRRLSASGRARRASSAGNISELVRSRSASSRVCCICLETIGDDEPLSDLFDCQHDAQTHKDCIDKWLEKHETCPLCRRDVKDPVIEQMRKQPNSVEAQIKGCRFIILKGWQNQDYQRHFVEVGAGELVVRAMTSHPDHMELSAASCAAIFVLAFASKEVQDRLTQLGACELVVQAMSKWQDDSEVQARGCGAVYSLSLSNKESQERLAQCGAHAAVLIALASHMDNSSIAISASDAIMSLACDSATGQELLGKGCGAESVLKGQGACELLAQVVDKYPAEREAIYAALDGTMKLAIDSPDNRLRFGAMSMCEKVLAAFERFGDDELFLLVALTAIYTMAENQEENQSRILQADGAKIIMQTLSRHSQFQDIVSVGLDVIFALTYNQDEGPTTASHPALREAGAAEFILKMLQEYPGYAEIYGPGLKAMACLLISPDNQAIMAGKEWCKAVTDSMAHAVQVGDMAVMEIACRVVGSMALSSDENQTLLRQGGACRMVCQCMKRGLSTWEALEVTADLAYNCPENRLELGQHGAVQGVLEGIEKVSTVLTLVDPATLDIAIMALTNLVQDCPENLAQVEGQLLGLRNSDRRVPVPVMLASLLPEDLVVGDRTSVLMTALSVFCSGNGTVQEMVGEEGACQATIDKIRRERDDLAIVKQGLQLLLDLTMDHEANQDRVREAGGLELLMDLFEYLRHDLAGAARWSATVAAVTEDNTESQDKLVDLGAARAVLEVQRLHSEDDGLTDVALGTLASLAVNNRRTQDCIAELAGCELVCDVAKRALKNHSLLTRCCSAVLALSELERMDEDGQPLYIWKDESSTTKRRFRSCGAAEVMSQVILQVADTCDLFVLGGLILSLALITEDDLPTSDMLRSNGTFDLVLKLLREHPEENTLITACGGFIATCSLVFNDDWSELTKFQEPVSINQDFFLQAGAVPALMKGIKAQTEEQGATIMGFIALAALSWRNPVGVEQVAPYLDALDKVLGIEAKRSPESIFYGLVLFAALIVRHNTDIEARCRPLITKWDSLAAKLYPSSNCLNRFRKLLTEHVTQRKAMTAPSALQAA